MDITHRDYQHESITLSVSFLTAKHKDNGLVILPTGSGKSIVIAGIIKDLKAKVLILQPSKEILIQNFNKYRTYGFYASVYSASLKRKEVSNTVFATIGSICKKPFLFKEFKYIIIDECHIVNPESGMYDGLIKALPDCKVIGLTATPYRLSNDGFGGSILKFLTRTRPRIFKKVIHYVQNKTLFDKGYLCPLQYYPVGNFDRSKIRKNTTGADFDERSLQEYYRKIDLKGSLVKVVTRLGEIRKNVLVFVRYIREAQHIVNNVPGAVMLTGETPDAERDSILKKFYKNEIKILVNIGVLTTGYDKPDLETIVLGRETMSLGLYYQMIGRGIRTHENKSSCWIVDTCGNYFTFGKIEDLHIDEGTNGKYTITSNGVPLTNEYFGEVFQPVVRNQISSNI